MKTYISTTGGGLTQAETEAAVEAALEQFSPDDIIATRYHDTSITNINAAGGLLVEIRVDDTTSGAALPAAVKAIQVSCTFGVPIEILSGPNSGSATRRLVANLGEGPTYMPVKMTSGHSIFVRSLNASAVSSGVLTVNLLG